MTFLLALSVALGGPLDSTVLVRASGHLPLHRGAGVIVSPGRVVTANHVIDGRTSILVRTGRTTARARVVRVDAAKDVAILKVPTVLPVATVARVEPPTGTSVTIAGSDRFGRRVTVRGTLGPLRLTTLFGRWMALHRLRAPVELGMSGGGVYTRANELVGIVIARSTREPGVGYMLPVKQLLVALHKED